MLSRTRRRPSLKSSPIIVRAGRWVAACGVGVSIVGFAGGAGARTTQRTTHRTFDHATVTVQTPVDTPGIYTVTVVVGGTSETANRVRLRIGDVQRATTTNRHHPRVRVRVRITIAGSWLTVRAVGVSERPRVQIELERVRPPAAKTVTTPSSTASSSSTGATTPSASSTTTATATTTTTTTTTVAPPPPSGPPGPGSPYTNLVWSDDFTQDWSREGGAATEPVSNQWIFDNFGTCGNGSETTYTGSSSAAWVSSQGLVIPVTSTGPTSYTSARVDTRGISGESWDHGTIEASIQLPAGQGLCPAFWMYGDNNTAEIDILEAPAFVGSQYGQYAPYAVGTLHANNLQEYESGATPPGWVPGHPNVYGVIWTPTSITWTLNYVPYAEAGPSSIADPSLWGQYFTGNKLHLIFDNAVGGWPGTPPPNTTYPQPMIVQWVKVYQ